MQFETQREDFLRFYLKKYRYGLKHAYRNSLVSSYCSICKYLKNLIFLYRNGCRIIRSRLLIMTIISDLFITDVKFCLTKLLFNISLHQICMGKSVSLSKTEQISRPLSSVLLQTIFDNLKFRVGDHAFFISLPPQYINYRSPRKML